MVTKSLIDFDEFLQPISADSPTGKDIRADYSANSPYFEIKDSQAAARTDERRRRESFDETMDTTFSRSEWAPIQDTARRILKSTAKDLEIAVWHIEAMLRTNGFAGIRDGFLLLQKLVDRFWEAIHPRPDEDGLETTVACVTSLNGDNGPGTLIWPISNIPILEGKAWGTWQCRQAQSLEGSNAKTLEKRVAEGAITPEMLREAVKSTSPEFFRTLLDDIQQAIEAVEACGQSLSDRCAEVDGGYEIAPGTRNITEALREAIMAVRSIAPAISKNTEPAPELLETVGTPVATSEINDTSAVAGSGATLIHGSTLTCGTAGIVHTREQAFRAIQDLADHFKRTEPHSPISYLLEQAIRWGRLPLPQLLSELVDDTKLREEMFRMMGMPTQNE